MNTKSERESLAASTTVIQSSPLLHLSDGQDPVPAETARKQEGQARGAVGESKQAGWESRQVLVGRSQEPGARQAGRQAGTVGRQAGAPARQRSERVSSWKHEASKQASSALRCGSASASASDSRPSHSHRLTALSHSHHQTCPGRKQQPYRLSVRPSSITIRALPCA